MIIPQKVIEKMQSESRQIIGREKDTPALGTNPLMNTLTPWNKSREWKAQGRYIDGLLKILRKN